MSHCGADPTRTPDPMQASEATPLPGPPAPVTPSNIASPPIDAPSDIASPPLDTPSDIVSPPEAGQVTRLISAAACGDRDASERLWSLVYDELHRVAQRQLNAEAPGHTLQPTTLVHEVYLRLAASGQPACSDRRHFFATAAKIMRQIRVDYARMKRTLKRGGAGCNPAAGSAGAVAAGGSNEADRSGPPHFNGVPADPPLAASAGLAGDVGALDPDPAALLALDEALGRLERADPRKAEVVNLRYFVGLTIEETAEVLGLSTRCVQNEWSFARVWLHREMSR